MPAFAPGRAAASEESRCKLVQVAGKAMRDEMPAHEALLDAGFIRRLGAEALRA